MCAKLRIIFGIWQQLTPKVQNLHFELHFGLHFGEIFASDIDVAIKTYYADYQSVCFTKKG